MSLATGRTEELLRRALLEYARGRHDEADSQELIALLAEDSATPQPAPVSLASIGAIAAAVAVH